MPIKDQAGGTAKLEIISKLRLLTALTTFLVMLLVAIILAFIYEPVRAVLGFLPDISVTIIVLIALVLTAVLSYLSRMLTRRVVGSIELYSTRLDGILNITREIREEIYIDKLLHTIIQYSIILTNSRAGSILLREGDFLIFKAAEGPGLGDLPGKAVPVDKGITGWVVEHGTPLFLEDMGISVGFESCLTGLVEYGIDSALCVPLATRKGVRGVIELNNKKKGRYDDRDAEMVSYLADQAAISIERAEFYEDQKNYEVHITDMLIELIDNSVPEEMLKHRHGHSKRVARYTNMLAKAMGMSDEKRRRLYFASLLHDIGFLKTTPGEDFTETAMRRHPREGYQMLSSINFYKDIAPFVLRHHERFDGKGYPEGLKGTDIPIEARIIAVAEAFDTSACNNPGGGADGFRGALSDIKKQAGSELDQSLVAMFVRDVEGTFE